MTRDNEIPAIFNPRRVRAPSVVVTGDSPNGSFAGGGFTNILHSSNPQISTSNLLGQTDVDHVPATTNQVTDNTASVSMALMPAQHTTTPVTTTAATTTATMTTTTTASTGDQPNRKKKKTCKEKCCSEEAHKVKMCVRFHRSFGPQSNKSLLRFTGILWHMRYAFDDCRLGGCNALH